VEVISLLLCIKVIVLTVKKLLKSVYTYGSYRKIKTGVLLFWTTLYSYNKIVTISLLIKCKNGLLVTGTLNLREWTMHEWTIWHHIAGMEFVGVDKSARCGTMLQGWTMRKWTMQEWSNACGKCAQDKLKVTDCM